MTLLDWLIARYPNAKRQNLKRMVEAGRVTIDGTPATRLKQPIADGAVVRVNEKSPAQRPPVTVEPPKLFEIVFEDADVLVINKPAGLLTSTVPREKRPTALAAVRRYIEQFDPKAQVGLIHRLDRDAAGLLVFSKSHLAYESLKTQFFKHTVTRVYTAIVRGAPTPRNGTIDTHLVERADGTVYSTKRHGQGQRAVTEYETIHHADGRSTLRVTLRTGRKHQIRVHLSERGLPIIGDEVYGGPDPAGLRLAAVMLEFDHPRSGKRLTFQIKPPWPDA
jgi:23S rRNA pseudouridine1911/1915/1917 synthase